MMLGRGIRFQTGYAPIPGVVLVYIKTASRSSAALTDPKLKTALTEAGHKLRIVEGKGELDETLKSGQYDIVMSDVAAFPEVEEAIHLLPSAPVFLPVVYEGTKAEVAAAKKQYKAVMKAPAKAGQYCLAIDKVMESRAKPKHERKAPAVL